MTHQPPTSVAEAFKVHSIVADVIPQAPTSLLEVKYDDNNIRVRLGNELTPTQVKAAPAKLVWPTDQDNGHYTLVMTAPDAPSRADPSNGQVQHWLVGNIPGCNVERGVVLTDYIGSGPPKGAGVHRYVFLVYKQPNGPIEFDEKFISKTTLEGRIKTQVTALVKKYGLTQPPHAGNFYQAQYDDYVPELHKQLGVPPQKSPS